MLKRSLAAAAFALCFTAPAIAQDAVLPPVESMDCTAMTAEMTTAGMQMNSQFDREGFATDQAATEADMERRRREATTSMAVTGAACMIPGMGAACMAAQQAQAARAQQGVPEAQERQQRQIDRVQNSMAGIDQNRMMAMSQRYEQLRCETPQ